ncbi:MAG: Na+/H+ antiporter subunit E [Clostridia bacterium]
MFLLLFLLWIVFNGKVTLEIILIGLFICAMLYLFCWKFLGYSPKTEINHLKKLPLFIKYVGILIKEIFMANIIVLKLILRKKKVKPVLYFFNTDFKTDAMRVLLSYSITLTPGTITVDLKGDRFAVHCLDESLCDGLSNSSFVDILKRIES